MHWLFFAAFVPLALGFPDYDDPRTAVPAIERPQAPSCTVPLFSEVAIRDFNTVFSNEFVLPEGCPKTWTKVVLDWDGQVNG